MYFPFKKHTEGTYMYIKDNKFPHVFNMLERKNFEAEQQMETRDTITMATKIREQMVRKGKATDKKVTCHVYKMSTYKQDVSYF